MCIRDRNGNEYQVYACDTNRDDIIDLQDVVMLMQWILEFDIDSFDSISNAGFNQNGNVITIDSDGDIAGITTTSGLAWKIPGRVGDSPIIGAGLYLDNEVGAVAATGRGEEMIRSCGSFLGVELMRNGRSPQEACEEVCKRIVDINGGPSKVDFNDKIVALGKNGEVGCASIREKKGDYPEIATWSKKGFKVTKGTYLIEENN